jgi:DNA mismatch repair protein MutS
MALAYACCAYLANSIKAYTLFSTHYFELTTLPDEFTCIQNVHLKAAITNENIIFLYKVEAGHANGSYGLEVAALAGIPKEVLTVAKQHLQQAQNLLPEITIKEPLVNSPSAILCELAKIDADQLSPREALELIYRLKNIEATSI